MQRKESNNAEESLVDNEVLPWMICMMSAHGVLMLHRGVVGHPLWLNGLTLCQRVDNEVLPWMICMMSAHGVLMLHRGVLGHPL